jgi:LEA14-like dessication related protein
MQVPRIVVWLAAVGVAAACSGTPVLVMPRVNVESVRMDRMTGNDATFSVTLNLSNPNALEIAVDAVEANLTIEDIRVGSAVLRSPLRLPANGGAQAILQVRAGLSAVLQVFAEIGQRTKEQKRTGEATLVRYAVFGTATLEGGLEIPYSRSGEFRMGAPAPAAR